jgi:hypothetical protein
MLYGLASGDLCGVAATLEGRLHGVTNISRAAAAGVKI